MGHRMILPLAMAALLAAPSSAFMPTGTPVLRSNLNRSPMLSSRTKDGNLPTFGVRGARTGASRLFMSSAKFVVGVLGDLHIDPRKMEDYATGRDQFKPIFEAAKKEHGNVAVVSLGDLGESKSVRPEETSELFAGTTECHKMAAELLGSFGVPYEVIGGNHDLEGLDEFATDEENLAMFLREHNKPTMDFVRKIADKTLLVGMGSTVFRSAKYTSHEVVIDEEQMRRFEQVLIDHPSKDGWRIFVFTHAPPNGSGLRVLQENHVVNGCCWLNHSDDKQCRKFIELVRKHRCVKAWFSGHFHLGQDYTDSITFPTIDPKDGPYPNRGSCVFAQTSVMRRGTSRDGRQQSRLIRGDDKGFEICTVDHQKNGAVRVDATITYTDENHEIGVYAHKDEELVGDKYFKVYQPCKGDSLHPPDENYIPYNEEGLLHVDTEVTMETKAWWVMACGRTMGILNGMLVEYDSSTLAPLGLIVGADELIGKRIAVIDSGEIENCLIPLDKDGDNRISRKEWEAGFDKFDLDRDGLLSSSDTLGPDLERIFSVLDTDVDGLITRKEYNAGYDMLDVVGMEGADCAVSAGQMREQALVKYDMSGMVTVVQPNEDGSYWRKIVRNKMVRMKESRRVKAAKAFARETFKIPEDGEVKVVSSWGPYMSTSGTAKKTGVAGLTAPAVR